MILFYQLMKRLPKDLYLIQTRNINCIYGLLRKKSQKKNSSSSKFETDNKARTIAILKKYMLSLCKIDHLRYPKHPKYKVIFIRIGRATISYIY